MEQTNDWIVTFEGASALSVRSIVDSAIQAGHAADGLITDPHDVFGLFLDAVSAEGLRELLASTDLRDRTDDDLLVRLVDTLNDCIEVWIRSRDPVV